MTSAPVRPDLAGSRVVVTGAGHGIGKALARMLAREGARLVANDIDADAAHAVADEIGARAVVGDAASRSGVEDLVSEASAHLGSIDIWFGNAGIERGRGIDAPEEDWDQLLEVNVMAHVRAARLLIPDWVRQNHGRYVLTASAAGLLTMLGSPVYSVTKHAAVAFAEWMSATYRHRGVVVQAICPQGVQTRMLEEAGPLQGILRADSAVSPEQVAAEVREALTDDRFLILPHPRVQQYFQGRAADLDGWLEGMNRVQRRLES